MEATASTLLLRPAVARRCLTSTRTSLKQQLRTKATAARTRRALNIPPHPSFLTADARGGGLGQEDTIIFNPPSAAPSVYHTPFKFLPRTDPRRRANLASLFEKQFSSPSATNPGDVPVIPGGERVVADRGPITREEVAEMRRLRSEDPHRWNVHNLSVKYDLPRGFIMACCQAPKEKIEFERRKMELIQARWGPAKKKAHEDRLRRREMLYRGEI